MKRDPNLIRLSRDHHRGLVMAMRIARELPPANAEEVQSLYSELKRFWENGLLPHFRTECECLLSRLVRHVEYGDDLIRRTQSDHLHIHALMTSMIDTDDTQHHRRTLEELGEALREHIKWEEQTLFEATQRLLRPDEMKMLGEDTAERIPEIPESTWPGQLNL
jgi:hypothetical protein